MKESIIKNIILVFMLSAKIFTVLFIIHHYDTDGLTKDETYSAITLILPLFTVYLTVIIKDLLSNPYRRTESKKEKTKPVKRVKTAIPIMTFLVFPAYFIAIIVSIIQTAKGNFTGEELQKSIGIIESAFGVYIGLIIFALFKEGIEE